MPSVKVHKSKGAVLLLAWRRKHAITNARLGQLLNLSMRAACCLCMGRSTPTLASAIAIEDLTGVPVRSWLQEGIRALYDEIASTLREGDEFVEVGVAYGSSLVYLADREWPRGNPRLWAVDLWDEHMGADNLPPDVFARMQSLGSPMDAFVAMVNEHLPFSRRDVIAMRKLASVEAAREFEDATVLGLMSQHPACTTLHGRGEHWVRTHSCGSSSTSMTTIVCTSCSRKESPTRCGPRRCGGGRPRPRPSGASSSKTMRAWRRTSGRSSGPSSMRSLRTRTCWACRSRTLPAPTWRRKACCLTTTDALIGVAYVVRRSALREFLLWRATQLHPGWNVPGPGFLSEDTMLGLWCAVTRRKVYHPIPTPIDHDTSIPSTYGNDEHHYRKPLVTWRDAPAGARLDDSNWWMAA